MVGPRPLVLPNKEPCFSAGFSGVFVSDDGASLVAPKGLALALPKGDAPGSVFLAPPPKGELDALDFFLFGDAPSPSPALSLAAGAEKLGAAAAGVTAKPLPGTPNMFVAALPNMGLKPAGF